MKVGFLISTAAGKGSYEKWEKSIAAAYSDNSIMYTTNSGDVYSMAREFAEQDGDILVLLGGDGSLSEAAQALSGTETALTLIPTGSGNDFSRLFDYDKLNLSQIENAEIKPIDLYEVNGTVGINVFSLGFDTNSLAHTYKFNEKFGKTSKLSYIYGPFASIVKREYVDIELDLNLASGEKFKERGKFLISAVCNGSYYGSGFMPSPYGKIDDGILNLILVKPMGPIKILSLFLAYRKGEHMGKKGIRELLVKSGHIKSEKDFLYNIDGQLLKDNELEFKIKEKALKWAYIVPQAERIERPFQI